MQRGVPPMAPRAPVTDTAALAATSSSSSPCRPRRRATTVVQFVKDEGEVFALHIFAPQAATTTTLATTSSSALLDEAARTTLPVLFCVHGAGMSGDNFSRLADHLHGVATDEADNGNTVTSMSSNNSTHCNNSSKARDASDMAVDMYVVAYDMRCHGASTHAGGGEAALTLRVLVDDCAAVLHYTLHTLFPHSDCFVLGHSLGGAVAVQTVRCASPAVTVNSSGGGDSSTDRQMAEVCGGSEAVVARMRSMHKRLCGVVLLDVVEGTARQSLHYMRAFLQKRPNTFATVHDACTWFVQCGGMRSVEGAAVSVPPLLRRCHATSAAAACKCNCNNDNNSSSSTVGDDDNNSDVCEQCDDDDTTAAMTTTSPPPSQQQACCWTWRTNLHAMRAVWDGWFVGLDKAFVQLTCPRMLCLANVERLDTELTIAQMRGQFQLEIIGGNCGHYIMDDAPALLAQKLQRFVWRVANMQRVLQEKLKRPHA